MREDQPKDRRGALAWLAGGGIVAALAACTNRSRPPEPAPRAGGIAATFTNRAMAVKPVETDIEVKDVPKAVLEAAERVMPKGEWLSAVKIVDGESVAYELDGTRVIHENEPDMKLRDVTMMVTSEAKVIEVDTKLLSLTKVPQVVLDKIHAKWEHFTPKEAHRIYRGKDLKKPKDGEEVYDMLGTLTKDREAQFLVTAEGEILESTVEIDLEKVTVPDEVTKARKADWPKFQFITIYAVRESGKLIGYRFEGKGPKGRDKTLFISHDGTHAEVVE